MYFFLHNNTTIQETSESTTTVHAYILCTNNGLFLQDYA